MSILSSALAGTAKQRAVNVRQPAAKTHRMIWSFLCGVGFRVNRIIDELGSAGNQNSITPEGEMRMFIMAALAIAIGIGGSARADEDKVPLDKVPKPVLEAAKKRFPDAKFSEA